MQKTIASIGKKIACIGTENSQQWESKLKMPSGKVEIAIDKLSEGRKYTEVVALLIDLTAITMRKQISMRNDGNASCLNKYHKYC